MNDTPSKPSKRGPGRPRRPVCAIAAVRMELQWWARLDAIADRQGIARGTALWRAVQAWIVEEEKKIVEEEKRAGGSGNG